MIVMITDEIIGALLKLKLVHGSNEELGRLLGMSKKHIGQILNGNVAYVRRETWNNMAPHLKRLLPKDTVQESTEEYRDIWDRLATWLRHAAKPADRDFILNAALKCGFTK
jgi:transcriptional regulator with XRE-family HTH domain